VTNRDGAPESGPPGGWFQLKTGAAGLVVGAPHAAADRSTAEIGVARTDTLEHAPSLASSNGS